MNQKLAKKILEKYNHGVTVANNGLEAFEPIKKRRYDVKHTGNDFCTPLCPDKIKTQPNTVDSQVNMVLIGSALD